MNNQQRITALIKSISGQANTLTIPRVYIALVGGNIEVALFLSQSVYWSDRTTRPDGFFFKSYREWEEEIGLSQFKIKNAADKLVEMGVMQTKIKKANKAPTVHYRVDIRSLTDLIIKFLDNQESEQSDYEETQQSDYQETSQSLTETTTETTTEITAGGAPAPDEPGALSPLSEAFVNVTSIPELTGGVQRWMDALAEMQKAGVEPQDVVTAVREMRDKGLSIASLRSVVNPSIIAMSKRKSKKNGGGPAAEEEPDYEALAAKEAAERRAEVERLRAQQQRRERANS